MNDENKLIFDFSSPDLYVPVYIPVFHDKRPNKFIFGSRNSAKSNFAAQYLITRLLNEPTRGVLVRKVFDSIRESQFETIKKEVERYGRDVSSHFKFTVSPMKIEVSNGNRVICSGMDKADKAKSIKDPNFIWFEEADQLERADFRNTVLSIRGNGRKEFIATFNAPREDSWIVNDYLDDWSKWERTDGMHTYVRRNDPKNMILHTNYLMNPYADQEFKDHVQWLKENDYEDYRVQGLGMIGTSRTGHEFFGFFKRDNHVAIQEASDRLSYHLSFDFNNYPYSTCLVYQVRNYDFHQIGEICLEPPDNTIDDIARAFFSRYPGAREVFVYGDPSGQARTQAKSRGEARSYKDQIKRAFAKVWTNASDRFMTKAPPIAGRRFAWMEIMVGRSGIGFEVDPSCHRTLMDFERLQMDTDGHYSKTKYTDKQLGVSYEKYGHCADAGTYFFAYHFRRLFY